MSRLSPEQRQRLEVTRREWRAVCTSTELGDRRLAEEAALALYERAGLSRPGAVRWVAGPRHLAEDWQALSRWQSLGRNVRRAVLDDLQSRASVKVQAAIGFALEAAVMRALRPAPVDPLREIMGQTLAPLESEPREVRRGLARLLGRLRPNQPQRRLNFWHDALGQSDFAWLAAYLFFRRHLALEQETDGIEPLLGLARSVGWVLPHANVCWLVERPSAFELDAEGRLHSPAGPALAYRDGSSWYAWKGVGVPGWVIERSNEITAETIEAEPDGALRRCLIEIITPERYIAASKALCISNDETGRLWVKPWSEPHLGGWAAVEVVNGTPEPDGTFKHYFLQVPFGFRTARAAVAWTYGLREYQYAALSVRT